MNKKHPRLEMAGDFFIFDKIKIMKTIFLLLVSGICFSQTADIKSKAARLYDAIYNIDVDQIIAMSCNTDADKTAIYDKIDKAFLNDELKLRFSLTGAKFDVSPEKIINDKLYHLVTYRNVLRITYYKPLSYSDLVEIPKKLKQSLKAQSVKYEKHRNAFLIVYPGHFIASKVGNDWRITVADNTFQYRLFDDCLGQDVLKGFGLE
jgi:hypothetical protein